MFASFFFYENLSSFGDIETNCSVAMKATPLINSLRMAFYLMAFDVRQLCTGDGRTQLRAPFIAASPHHPPTPPLTLLTGPPGRPSFRKYWLPDSVCVCIRKVELRREIANAFFCAWLCVHSGSLCTNGETGGESTPEGSGSCKKKKKKKTLERQLHPPRCRPPCPLFVSWT